MPDPNVPQGQPVDLDEVQAVFIAIKARADEKVPAWERSMVSDELLRDVATTAVTASVKYRTAKSF